MTDFCSQEDAISAKEKVADAQVHQFLVAKLILSTCQY
jgi:hypothetical protein